MQRGLPRERVRDCTVNPPICKLYKMIERTIPPSFAAQNPPPFAQGRLIVFGESLLCYLPLLGEPVNWALRWFSDLWERFIFDFMQLYRGPFWLSILRQSHYFSMNFTFLQSSIYISDKFCYDRSNEQIES